MRYLILFAVTIFLASCGGERNNNTDEKGKFSSVWKPQKNRGYYSCYNNSKELISNPCPDGSNNCGVVKGNGEVPTEFIFLYNDEADISKIEADLRLSYPLMQVDSCSCNPRLRKYSSFPVYEIGKSGTDLAVKNTGKHGEGFDVVIPDVMHFAPNYILVRDSISREDKQENKPFLPDTTLEEYVYPRNNRGSKKLKVAILDTGYGNNSGRCKNANVLGIDCPYFKYTCDDDIDKHGTKVTDLILKQLKDSVNLVTMIPVKILDNSGKGSLFDLICVLSSLKGKKVDIINMSLGFYAPKDDSTSFKLLTSFVKDTDALILAAAGNAITAMDVLDGTNSRDLSVRNLQFFPACLQGLDKLIAVTSGVQNSGQYVVCSTQNYSKTIVDAAVKAGSDCRFDIRGYRVRGTSFATPVVAGKAGLYLLRKSLNGSTVNVSNLLSQIPGKTAGSWSPSQIDGDLIVSP